MQMSVKNDSVQEVSRYERVSKKVCLMDMSVHNPVRLVGGPVDFCMVSNSLGFWVSGLSFLVSPFFYDFFASCSFLVRLRCHHIRSCMFMVLANLQPPEA